MVWTLIEPGIAIVAASMATIRPLLRRMRVRGFESTDNPSTYGHNSAFSTSRKGRSRAGSVPLQDVTLQDLDAKTGPSTTTKTKPKPEITVQSFTFTELNKSLPVLPENDPRLSAVPSEVYPIQGDAKSPSWSADQPSPGSRSFEQIHDLEAQNQDGGLRLSDVPRR